MSVGISNTDLIDLQKTTLADLPNMEFEVVLNQANYPVVNMWFRDQKKQIESGTSIERNIMLDTTGNAKHVRLYQKTPINVGDVQQKITAPWCQVQTHYSIERREALRNRAPAAYIELLKSRRIDATLDLAKLLERRAWVAPNNANDDLNPRGLPYWLSFLDNAVTNTGDFLGKTIRYGDLSTSTVKGGLDGSTYNKPVEELGGDLHGHRPDLRGQHAEGVPRDSTSSPRSPSRTWSRVRTATTRFTWGWTTSRPTRN
jgi:hypothetical protein